MPSLIYLQCFDLFLPGEQKEVDAEDLEHLEGSSEVLYPPLAVPLPRAREQALIEVLRAEALPRLRVREQQREPVLICHLRFWTRFHTAFAANFLVVL